MAKAKRPVVAIGNAIGAGGQRIRRSLSNGPAVSAAMAAVLAASGFGAFYLGWQGAAASLVPGVQIAYLVSAGLAGFGLLVTGLGLLMVQVSRHLAARERDDLDEVVDRSLTVLEAVISRGDEADAAEPQPEAARSEVQPY